jgi:hypothetical protein
MSGESIILQNNPHRNDATSPKASVTVLVFDTPDGHGGHFVKIEGELTPLDALNLAVRALLDRLVKAVH